MIVFYADKGQKVPEVGEPMMMSGVKIGEIMAVEDQGDCYRVVVD